MSTESMATQADFEREERYIVVKRKHLTEEQEDGIREAIELRGIDTVECVVVESDWPEYETVWRMIEARVTGRAAYPDQAYVTGLRDLAAQREPDAIAGVLRDCADMIERHRTAAQPEREAVTHTTESMVTQADKDAAAALLDSLGGIQRFEKIGISFAQMNGAFCDAFARHRTAAPSEREAALEEAVLALHPAWFPSDHNWQQAQKAIRALKTAPAPAVSTEGSQLIDALADMIAQFDADFADEMAEAETTGERPDLWPGSIEMPIAMARAILARLGEGG